MVASTAIKYFVHTNTNAPQLDNVQGSMITVLDACLVNGLTLGAVDSITATGTTVTVNFSTTHNLLRFQVIKIAGAAQAEYNGEHRILSVPTTSSVTFGVATAPSVSPATGTIVASLPPVGWSLPFTATGKRAYKNTDIESPYLRVVDAVDPSYTTTYAKYAKVGMVEDMTDIDTMLGHQSPYDAALPDKNWVGTGSGGAAYNGWAKWFYATAWSYYATTECITYGNNATTPSSYARSWLIVGNGETFYIFVKSNTGNTLPFGFGKLKNLSPIEASPYFLASREDYLQASETEEKSNFCLSYNSTSEESNVFLFKNYLNASVLARAKSRVLAVTTSSRTGGTGLFALPTEKIPVVSSEYILAESGTVPRGVVPILRWIYQAKPYLDRQTVSEGGKMLLAGNCSTGMYEGQLLFDLGAL